MRRKPLNSHQPFAQSTTPGWLTMRPPSVEATVNSDGYWVCNHWTTWRQVWEYLAILCGAIVPMEMLLVAILSPDATFPIYAISFVFDVFFAADNFVIRRTILLGDGSVICKPKQITRAYGRLAIWLHTLSLVPLGWIGIILGNRWVYLVLSLNRCLRLHRGYRALKNTLTLLPYVSRPYRILPLLYLAVFTAHVFASILMEIAEAEGYENSIIAVWAMRNTTKTQKYFVCFYYVITTILTIGFGDITPVTLREVVFTVVLEITGVTLLCVITSNLVAILMDTEFAQYTEEYAIMGRYLRFWKVSEKEQHAMREFAQYQWESTRGTANLREVLQGLPPSIRRSIQFEMTRQQFSSSPTFQALGPGHLIYITDSLIFKSYCPGEVLYEQGEHADRMFFCRSGIVSIIVDGTVTATRRCDGNLHCEYECLTGRPNAATVKAVTYTDAWIYRMESFVKLLSRKADIRMLVLDRFAAIAQDQFGEILETLVPDPELRASVTDFNRRRGMRVERSRRSSGQF
jgi:hyperpolarization activated cyclic nucleotide-gated potassium channel 2